MNYKLFNYLYEESEKYGIQMSIYVDDITFSSVDKIPQEFIDKLFGLMKSNGMSIKKPKVHNYKKDSYKKVTGVYIKGKITRVDNRKKMEMKIIHDQLVLLIKEMTDLNSYFVIYNLYLKFYGNYQHINLVEKRVNDRYASFKEKYDKYFPKGITKINKLDEYKKNNIKSLRGLEKIKKSFSDLKSYNKSKV